MKKRIYTYLGFITAIIVWFLDACVHYFIFGENKFEFIPEDKNELWMRIIIITLIILVGILIDHFTKKIITKEKQLEATKIYESTLSATHHILNNFLHKMPLFRMEAMRSKDFNPEYIESFDQAISQASELVKRLSEIEHITSKNIKASIDPENIAKSQTNDRN